MCIVEVHCYANERVAGAGSAPFKIRHCSDGYETDDRVICSMSDPCNTRTASLEVAPTTGNIFLPVRGNFDPVTLTFKLGLDIVNINKHT